MAVLVDQQNLEPSLTGHACAVQAGSTRADDDDVERQPFHTNGKASCFRKPLGT